MRIFSHRSTTCLLREWTGLRHSRSRDRHAALPAQIWMHAPPPDWLPENVLAGIENFHGKSSRSDKNQSARRAREAEGREMERMRESNEKRLEKMVDKCLHCPTSHGHVNRPRTWGPQLEPILSKRWGKLK